MRISLFWRTFLLIGGLIVFSLAASLQFVRSFERVPPEQRLAWEIASVVNLTRSALVSAQGERRWQLLDELAREEDVRVSPMEPADRTTPLPDPDEAAKLERRLRSMLGPDTRTAGTVNDEPGLWVSFDIDDDRYWLAMSLERWTRQFGPPWWLIASQAILVSVLGALAISRLVNRPLATLAKAIGQVSSGVPAAPLPEHGPSEIAELNRHFNRMASDLAELEADRALALAGISHDLRTPLTRLRMEIELSGLDEAEKESMASDIERIDAIVGKFVEYARSGPGERGAAKVEKVDVAAVMGALRTAWLARIEAGELRFEVDAADGLHWRGDSLDLARIAANLVENAARHGHEDGTAAVIELGARRDTAGLLLEVADRGPGVAEDQLERLLRPFARVGDERSDRGGSGLGLAIVQRLAQRYGGRCSLRNRDGGGLIATVVLPDAAA
ncbi:MAG TPA: ATP-binding protein [Quisquiliibacterium sp.]|nr:ATP-binding protein [Quisquiliibacterium sp.]